MFDNWFLTTGLWEDTLRGMILYVHEEECLSVTSGSLKANIIYMKKLHGYKECYTIFE